MDDWDDYVDDQWEERRDRYDEYDDEPASPRLDNWLQGLNFSGPPTPAPSRRHRRSDSDPAIFPLCHICSKIELSPTKLAAQTGVRIRNEISLGPFDEVCLRSKLECAFCRLVISAINEFRKESYAPDEKGRYGLNGSEEVEIAWWGGNVQGFSVNLAMSGARLCFVDESAKGSFDLVLRGRLLEGEAFSAVRLKNWMRACRKCHGKTCEPLVENVSKDFGDAGFRLIDVRDMQIVEGPENAEYVALSYVWGTVPTLRLQKENKEKLMQLRGLNPFWWDIPKTIQDAINLTDCLGMQYLWVDALCLVQDDEEDMKRGVFKMKLIYGGSALTIIGAAGSHANVGLPGVRYGSRPRKQVVEEITAGVKMTIVNSVEDMLSISYYSDRAWTFQEQLLSQRTVIFTHNGGIFFRCLGAVWSEDTTDDKRPEVITFEPGYLYSALNGTMPPPSAYDALLLNYTERSLTKQSDARNAFAGLEALLEYELKCSFIEGIPTAAFDLFILFGGHFNILKRRGGFPSWSWAGWMGRVRWEMRQLLLYKEQLSDWLERRTWIVWYMSTGSNAPVPIRLDRHRQISFIANETEIYKSRSGFDNRHCPDIDVSRTVPSENLSLPPQPAGATRLHFWTLSLYLKFSAIEPSQIGPNILSRGTLTDRFHNFCGSINLDSPSSTKPFVSPSSLNKAYEFILLSKCWDPQGGSAIDDHPSWHGTRLGIGPYMWDLYWVMLIEWDETGKVAERRGLGQVYEDVVRTCEGPGPVWKEIVLG